MSGPTLALFAVTFESTQQQQQIATLGAEVMF